MSFLLDTNALSEMRKIRLGRADPKVAAWSEQVTASDLFVSVITLQEIEQGLLLLQRRDAAQAGALRHWFDAQVLPLFAGRTLLAIAAEHWQESGVLEDARKIMRLALDGALEGRELRTRDVARAVSRRTATRRGEPS